jgi:hypothetical protein
VYMIRRHIRACFEIEHSISPLETPYIDQFFLETVRCRDPFQRHPNAMPCFTENRQTGINNLCSVTQAVDLPHPDLQVLA